MKDIVIIGASGTIGRAVAELLDKDNHVIRVGHTREAHTVDLGHKTSIEKLLETIGTFDAIICAAGISRFGPLGEASDDDYAVSIKQKLMGQINLARIAQHHLASNGSITLTSGLLAQAPRPGTVPTAMVNAGLEGFVRAAALDLGKGIRINAVSPIYVTESARKMGMDTAGTMSAAETARSYQVSMEGNMTGQVLDVREYGAVEDSEK